MGIISIDTQYRILIKPESQLWEAASLYPIRKLAGQGIALPKNEAHYPSLKGLSWHRKRFGF